MELNYRQYSDQGPPLVIMHGLFGNLRNWNWHAQELAGAYAVYSLDLRNHGESPHTDSMSYPEMASDVLQFLDGLAIDKAILLGHSMGGKVAMQMALGHGDRVEKLLVADIAPVTYGSERGDHESVFAGLLAVDLPNLNSRQDAGAILAEHIPEEGVRQFLLSNLIRDTEGHYRWRFNLAALQANYDRLREGVSNGGKYSGPTLFLRGALSNYIRDRDEPTLHRFFPAAVIETVDGAGHWLHAEKPEEVLRRISDFLTTEAEQR